MQSRSRICSCGFQSPPREGRIGVSCRTGHRFWTFPVTSPRGEDPRPPARWKSQGGFPVTSPRGEDPLGLGVNPAHVSFPVTSPRGEDPPALSCTGWRHSRFQSPPREGRIPPPMRLPASSGMIVSSHLPARGGSIPWASGQRRRRVSSHLPARGGSLLRNGLVNRPRSFPVTSPRGEDRDNLLEIQFDMDEVSSHLPARGGSLGWSVLYFLIGCFQSPPREGRIHGVAAWYRDMDVSSHLPARGGSGGQGSQAPNGPCFQSPPREGRISFSRGSAAGGYSFQSPPREGRIRRT